MRFFFDTSCLVKYFLEENGTIEVIRLLSGLINVEDSHIVLTCITKAEAVSAVTAAHHRGSLEEGNMNEALSRLESVWPAFDIVPVTMELINLSGKIAYERKLRGADSFQLACAIYDETDILVSSDKELNQAAIDCGLAIWDPTDQSAMELIANLGLNDH